MGHFQLPDYLRSQLDSSPGPATFICAGLSLAMLIGVRLTHAGKTALQPICDSFIRSSDRFLKYRSVIRRWLPRA
jgi:hypothetical protein